MGVFSAFSDNTAAAVAGVDADDNESTPFVFVLLFDVDCADTDADVDDDDCCCWSTVGDELCVGESRSSAEVASLPS